MTEYSIDSRPTRPRPRPIRTYDAQAICRTTDPNYRLYIFSNCSKYKCWVFTRDSRMLRAS